MRTLCLVLFSCLVATAGYVYYLPFKIAGDMGSALEGRRYEDVADHIDFDSFWNSYHSLIVLSRIKQQSADEGFEAAFDSSRNQKQDELLQAQMNRDHFPDFLRTMDTSVRNIGSSSAPLDGAKPTPEPTTFMGMAPMRARERYVDINTFEVVLSDPAGQDQSNPQFRVTFCRSGAVDWLLCRINQING